MYRKLQARMPRTCFWTQLQRESVYLLYRNCSVSFFPSLVCMCVLFSLSLLSSLFSFNTPATFTRTGCYITLILLISYNGGQLLFPPISSKGVTQIPFWCEWLRSDLPLSKIPLVHDSIRHMPYSI